MNCIKTGARVYLPEYNQTMVCDVHQVGDCTLFRMNMALFDTKDSSWGDLTATHSASVNGDVWWRKDLGILVVPTSTVEHRPPED